MKNLCFLLPLALLVAASCSNEQIDHSDVYSVSIDTRPFNYECDDETKASIVLESGSPQFYWQDTDEVGIFPNMGGYQLGFSLAGQGGQKKASFNGGGWALRSDAAYSTYYPFGFDNKNPRVIPVSFLGQKQNGNRNMEHLGPYYFSASEPTSAVDGSVSFVLDNVASIIQFSLTLPDAKSYSEIILATDADLFTTSGTYNLQDFDLSLTPKKRTDKITLALENVTTTSPNQTVVAYMMVAPFDLTGHSYKVYVKATDGLFYSADLASKNHVLPRATARGITATVALSDGYNMGIGDWENDDTDYGGTVG